MDECTYEWMAGLKDEWTGGWVNEENPFFMGMPASGQPNKDLGVRGDVVRNRYMTEPRAVEMQDIYLKASRKFSSSFS